jgi:hypothetical protein
MPLGLRAPISPGSRQWLNEAFGLSVCENRAGNMSAKVMDPNHKSNQKTVISPFPMKTFVSFLKEGS